MDYGPIDKEYFDTGNTAVSGSGLFITCEGNFMYGNASLSYYDPESKHVENEVFARANGKKLGDVAQSMIIRGRDRLDRRQQLGGNFRHRYQYFQGGRTHYGFYLSAIHPFLSDEKAYVTQIWDPRIYIINPRTFEITGYVETDMNFKTGSTEQMVQYDKYVLPTVGVTRIGSS